MTTVTFDTLKFVEKLKAAGVPEEQAKALSEAFREAQGEAELATKHDLSELEIKLTAKMERLEAKFTGEMTLVKWMLGLLLGGVLALVLRAFFPV